MNCPGTQTLERAFPSSLSDELSRHIATCPECGPEWRRMESLAARVRELPVEARDAQRVGAVRDAVLASAARRTQVQPASPWPRRALALAASIAIAALAATMWPSGVETTYRARVVAGASARFTHSSLPDEIVRLTDGTVSLDVEHLREGERLRVVTGDAEVEVRGTSFVVEAHDDRLSWVHVMTGVVEVRVKDAAPVRVGALEHWRPAAPAVIALAPAVTPPEIVKPIATPAPAVTPAVAGATRAPGADVESAYREAWDAYRAGRFARAASGFGGVLDADPSGALASDAAWWRAVALSRAGRTAEAKAALEGFLRDFRGSAREGEASVMLGWILFEERELGGARSAFERAERLGPDAVRSSAAEGLAALEALR